jgi:calcium/calmodulin-dependent protein kinase I
MDIKHSVFKQIDTKVNGSINFWVPVDEFGLKDIRENSIYSSELFLAQEGGALKRKNFISTRCTIYYCTQKNFKPKRKSEINWKIFEPFTENISENLFYGFIIGQRQIQKFYTKDSRILDNWIEVLSQTTIMTNIDFDYVIIKEIGYGSYSKVHLAQRLEDLNEFAIKSISKKRIKKSSRGISAIISEIDIMRKINHPMFAKLLRVYETETSIDLVLKYVKPGDLFRKLRQKIKFSEREAKEFMRNMLEALDYLHSINIMHRDLKLENILMVSDISDCSFIICDFGLACSFEKDLDLVCGSAGYIAPEILQGKPYNSKADLYSAGIILYIMLTGSFPFEDGESIESISKKKEFRINPWDKVSRDAKNFLSSLTNPNPQFRFSAAEALKHPWLDLSKNPSLKYSLTPSTNCYFDTQHEINTSKKISLYENNEIYIKSFNN